MEVAASVAEDREQGTGNRDREQGRSGLRSAENLVHPDPVRTRVESIVGESRSDDSVPPGQQFDGEVKNVAKASYSWEKHVSFRMKKEKQASTMYMRGSHF